MSAVANLLDRYEVWRDNSQYLDGCSFVTAYDNEADARMYVDPEEAAYHGCQIWRVQVIDVEVPDVGTVSRVIVTRIV